MDFAIERGVDPRSPRRRLSKRVILPEGIFTLTSEHFRVESFWNYVRSDNYRRLYESHPVGIGSPPPKRNKEKKISRTKILGPPEKGAGSRAQSRER
jgi:hypothetical protein